MFTRYQCIKSISPFIAIAIALGTSACGNKQAFKPVEDTQAFSRPGTHVIPPKIDLLLVTDDTGSISEPYNNIMAQMPPFINKLENNYWDYHFASVPLTRVRKDENNQPKAVSQVVGSKFDSNWGSFWVPPYPGAQPGETGTVNPWYFSSFPNFSQFLRYPHDINFNLNGQEPGLRNILANLTDDSLYDSSFHRDDAMLAIVLIGNGEDTSGMEQCIAEGRDRRSDGYRSVRYCSEWTSVTNQYKNAFLNYQANGDHPNVRFYAAVSHSDNRENCLGGRALWGSRYQTIASTLGGATYDVCTRSIPTILDEIGKHLKGIRIDFRVRYLVLPYEPELSTVKVYKYIGGNPNNKVAIPNDPVNGWTYKGHITDTAVIDYPVLMNKETGYAIELHGGGRLFGEDTGEVTYKRKGTNSVHE